MKKTNKHILFITISNLANNPRLYKEACLALDHGISITIIQFLLGNWSDDKTNLLVEELNLRHKNSLVIVKTLSATRSNKLKWLFFALVEKCFRVISPLFKKNLWMAAFANNRRSAQIINFLNRNNLSFDLICAHNLGALFPAAYLFDKKGIPFIFDVEDYQRF